MTTIFTFLSPASRAPEGSRGPRLALALCLGLLAALLPQAARGTQTLLPAQRHRGSFLQADAAASRTRFSRDAVAAGADDTAHPTTFFGSFSQGESTYDEEADVGRTKASIGSFSHYTDGLEPTTRDRYERNLMDPDWFYESPSGDSQVAWQTYPGGHGGAQWTRTAGGGWKQEYRVPRSTGIITPGWFDSGVEQYDRFGRHTLPSMANPARFVAWQERSVNATMTCAEPGCVANTTLYAFNGITERARSCRLDVVVHPTDFDEQYSGEQVDWIAVNGVNVSVACQPLASGCNATSARPLYPCVRSLSLDRVIPMNGMINLSAKIPTVVDECPYNGNLLHAIPTVTCLIAEPIPLPSFTRTAPYQSSDFQTDGSSGNGILTTIGTVTADSNGNVNVTAPLHCPTAGCLATTVMEFNNPHVTNASSCAMFVLINATDFDNQEWSSPQEVIEFIQVGGVDVAEATNFNPGLNPCKAQYNGTQLAAGQAQNIPVVQNHDVTDKVLTGQMIVQGRISPMVDECASQGHLLDAQIQVRCTASSSAAAT